MPVRKANAEWRGDLKSGEGSVTTESAALDASYSFGSRFQDAGGANPEELIGAAHAGCFSMALAHSLAEAGFEPRRISTSASVQLEEAGEGFAITRIVLDADAEVPDIEESRFQQEAEGAKENCPVSRALAGVDIELNATLSR
ncbi:MAG: OsmC family protein [Gemmatimonadota bacterium]|nr:OsmC family protein [Gemmatimonadota bacterium]